MVEKKIKFEYFQLTQSAEGREALFVLEAWIAGMDSRDLQSRTHPYKEDKVRLEESYFNMSYNCWFLRFMRQRSFDVPSLSGSNTLSEFMVLDDDQYVSEDVACLYDDQTHVLMVQKNQHSVSPVGLEQYFNNTTPNNVVVNLRKIVSTDSFSRAERADKYKMFQVRLADIEVLRSRGLLENLRSSIGDMVRSMQNVPSPYIELTFSVGRSRNLEVDENESNRILSDIRNNPLSFDRAKATIIEENETKATTIDLFLDSPNDVIVFTVTGRTDPIRFDAMMDEMAKVYFPVNEGLNRKGDIDRYLIGR